MPPGERLAHGGESTVCAWPCSTTVFPAIAGRGQTEVLFEDPGKVKWVIVADRGGNIIQLPIRGSQESASLLEAQMNDKAQRTETGLFGEGMVKPRFGNIACPSNFGQALGFFHRPRQQLASADLALPHAR